MKSLVVTALLLALALPAAAQSPVFVVRHAERADTKAPVPDPDLSSEGRARAQSLAVALKDAGITAIYVTSFKRTQQTAAPLAKALGLTPIVVPQDKTLALIEQLRKQKGAVLVVGHSDTVPEIVKLLGVDTPVTVAGTEFDHLFVVVASAAGKPAMVHLHYK